MARELVVHGYILVRGTPIDIPSYLVESGDIRVTLDAARTPAPTDEPLPPWLVRQDGDGRVVRLPEPADLDLSIDQAGCRPVLVTMTRGTWRLRTSCEPDLPLP